VATESVCYDVERSCRDKSQADDNFKYWPEDLRRTGEQLSSPMDILFQNGFRYFFQIKASRCPRAKLKIWERNIPAISS
jgi:hypothetical protein